MPLSTKVLTSIPLQRNQRLKPSDTTLTTLIPLGENEGFRLHHSRKSTPQPCEKPG